MDDRSVLKIYRSDEWDVDDVRSDELRQHAGTDPILARGGLEEDELDRIIGLKLRGMPVPSDLKARLLRIKPARIPLPPSGTRKLALLTAAIAVLAVFFGSWRGPFQPSVSLADYREEMVSFIRIDPVLEMETPQLARITAFLKNAGAPSRLNLPHKLLQMQHPLGCRLLRFRGQDVALICFGREQGQLVHLFVVHQEALAHLRESDKALHYKAEGDWMTATWIEGDQAYLITVEGDRAKLEKYLTKS